MTQPNDKTRPGMTDLAQVALDFCREVLGWEDVHQSAAFPSSVEGKKQPFNGFYEVLDYTDLDEVMDSVRLWCGANNTRFQIEMVSNPVPSLQRFRVRVWVGEQPWEACCLARKLGHQLLATCLGAARMLKAA